MHLFVQLKQQKSINKVSKLVFYTHICCLLYGVSTLKFQQEALIWLVTCTFSWCQSSEYEWSFMTFSHVPTQVLKTIFTTKNQNPIHTKFFYIKYSDFFAHHFFCELHRATTRFSHMPSFALNIFIRMYLSWVFGI